MRNTNEISQKITELQNQIDDRTGDKYILEVQIEILEAEDYDEEADKYFDSDDSWLHQGAETAREWLDGGEWE